MAEEQALRDQGAQLLREGKASEAADAASSGDGAKTRRTRAGGAY